QHLVNFGAPVTQMIRMGGGVPVVVGAVNATSGAQIDAALGPTTAAVVFVQSHHAVQKGASSLAEVIAIAHRRGLPVILDAAAEEDLRCYVAAGVDLVTYSGGKAIGGPTCGFVAGRRDLIDAVRAQGRGIGRPMKVGKEQVAGFLVALQEYFLAGEDAIARRNLRSVGLADLLQGLPGLTVGLERDEAGRDITRVALRPGSEAGLSARELAAALANGSPSIRCRTHQVSLGVLFVDPRELPSGAEAIIAGRVREIVLESVAAVASRGR
ncbi:MAG TPA: beta-eliminating lyase-related protein, partial [Chloroflexota bacterium]|nr:beta-eliminating lyase-related protein [Chloroflexota bacterium]